MATKAELKARLSLDTALFERGIAVAHSASMRLHSVFSTMGAGGVAIFAKLAAAAAALGGVAGFGLALRNALHFGEELDHLSQRTGVTAGKLAILQQAFKDAGLDAETVGTAINRMQRNMVVAEDRGSALGAEFAKIKGLAPDQQFLAVAAAIRAIENPAQRAKAAMEIFGRGGFRILPVIMDPRAMAEAAQTLGRQAELLNQNSAIFHRVSDQLEHAGVKIRGFFVGVASSLVGKLEPILERMEKLDFAAMGEKFGAALIKGAQALVGFLSNPKLMLAGITELMNAAMLSAGNVLLAVFKVAIQFFRDGFIAMFASLGDYIIGVLLKAFAKPLATFQAQLENVMTTVGKAVHTKTPWELYKVMKAGAGPEGEAAIQKRAREIMQEGGPRAGFGQGETAQEHLDRAALGLSDAMKAAANAMSSFALEDVTGSKDAWNKATQTVSEAITEGGKVIKEVMTESGRGIGQVMPSAMGMNLAPAGPSMPSIIRSGSGFFSGATGRKLFGPHSALNRSEREEAIREYSAKTGAPVVEGHQALREARKDAEKRELFKTLKAEAASEKSVTLLEDIKKASETTADAVGGE